MQKTKIEWCDYTINPVKGLCPVACPYCYARRMYQRFKWNPEIDWCPSVFTKLDKLKTGSRVFIGSTIELFGECVKEIWIKLVFEEVVLHPNITFIFLTKQPQNLIKWTFPDNCWVGVSYTGAGQAKRQPNLTGFTGIYNHMKELDAKVKFISIEPLLNTCEPMLDGLAIFDWVIIGQQTPVSKKTEPKIEWIREIVEAADKAGIPVFLKENLYDIFMSIPHEDTFWEDMSHLRQEFPTA